MPTAQPISNLPKPKKRFFISPGTPVKPGPVVTPISKTSSKSPKRPNYQKSKKYFRNLKFSLRVGIKKKDIPTSVSLSMDICVLWFMSKLPPEKKLQYLNKFNVDILMDSIYSYLGQLNSNGVIDDFLFQKGIDSIDDPESLQLTEVGSERAGIKRDKGSGLSEFIKKRIIEDIFAEDVIGRKLFLKISEYLIK